MASRRFILAFYFSTLLSSIGSAAFTLCCLVFLLRAGYPQWEVSLLIGATRFLPLLVMMKWGDISDRWRARDVVLAAEVVAFLSTFFILWAWAGGREYFGVFAAAVVVRSCVINLQTGGRGKIAKQLSDASFASNQKNSIWLTNATQGATLFAGIFGWYALENLEFWHVILFDAATFLVSGAIFLKVAPPIHTEASRPLAWREKFKALYNAAPRETFFDVLLAIALCGFWSFLSRAANAAAVSPYFFLISFGLAVWIAAGLERKTLQNIPSAGLWLTLSLSYFACGLFVGAGKWIIGLIFLRDISYWLLYHRITAHIQTKSPAASMASITSARFTQMVFILASGEFLVGAWSSSLGFAEEAFLRALIPLFALAIKFYFSRVDKKPRAFA